MWSGAFLALHLWNLILNCHSTLDRCCNIFCSLHPCLVLNLMFVHRSWQEVHRLSGASKGFEGAIQRVQLNGKPLPISAKLPICSFSPVNVSGCGFKIRAYDGLPCPASKNPCLNSGLCIPNLNEYSCRCKSNYEGKHCEMCK